MHLRNKDSTSATGLQEHSPVSYQDMAAIAKAENIGNASDFSAIFL